MTVSPETSTLLHELESYSDFERLLLLRRGITTTKDAESFFNPSYEEHIQDPFGILNMEKAVERILKAISQNERIAIYADYDCDGIPAAVILHDFFERIAYQNIRVYIPHRHKEGYGLHKHAIEELARDGVTLMITVDNGITNVDEAAFAQSLGIDLIITDHHLPQATLPPAFAVINSKQDDDTYHDNMLSGAGVAWKMVCALLARGKFDVGIGWEKWLLDMAGLAAIADLVPLRNENRAIAYFGLKVLRKSPRPGLQALLSRAGVKQHEIEEGDVGFTIAPRLNAASRMDDPRLAFDLLSTKDPVRAGVLAKELNKLNDMRKLAVMHMMKEIRASLAERQLREVIVIGNPKWRVGVVGLAAGTLAEEFGRPVFVWGREGGEIIKGSCRSEGTTNMVALMVEAGDVFLGKGGHEFSGGFSVSHEHIHNLEDALVLAHKRLYPNNNFLGTQKIKPEVVWDATITPEEVDMQFAKRLSRFAPFGMENPKPIFRLHNVTVHDVRKFGKNKEHVEFLLKRTGRPLSAVAFFVAKDSLLGEVVAGDTLTLCGHVETQSGRFGPPLRFRIISTTKL